MQEHQQRVVDEESALSEKLTALNKFINENDIFKTLDEAEKVRLKAQAGYMKGYLDILGQRIAAFK